MKAKLGLEPSMQEEQIRTGLNTHRHVSAARPDPYFSSSYLLRWSNLREPSERCLAVFRIFHQQFRMEAKYSIAGIRLPGCNGQTFRASHLA